MWEGSDSVGEPASLFTEILPDHYYPPRGFNFDAREIRGNQNILTDKTDDMIRKKARLPCVPAYHCTSL